MTKRTAIHRSSFRVAVTGHRHWKKPSLEKLHLFESLDIFLTLLPKYDILPAQLVFLHGCALGVDMWFGHYARIHDINFELFLPFNRETQIERGNFNSNQINELDKQIAEARNVVVVNKKYFTYGYQERNKVLVDSSDMLTTYYTRSRSGSGNAKRYAEKRKKLILDLIELRNRSDSRIPYIHDLNILLEML